MHCPKCASANIRLSRKTSSYDCEDCRHVWKDEKTVPSLRLFLSYGHDSNEELVRRIRADMEKRGHDVWQDRKIAERIRRALQHHDFSVWFDSAVRPGRVSICSFDALNCLAMKRQPHRRSDNHDSQPSRIHPPKKDWQSRNTRATRRRPVRPMSSRRPLTRKSSRTAGPQPKANPYQTHRHIRRG